MRRGMSAIGIVLAITATAIASAACGAIFDLSALGQGDDAGAPVTNEAGDAPIATVDAAIDGADAGPLEEDASAPCVFEAGAPMKRIGVICIDSIEVTNAQYATFLDRADAGTLGAAGTTPPPCVANTDRVPAENWPSPPDLVDVPVTGVSWCDAYSYCAYAGKRLCTKTTEWYRACSKAGTKIFPYGNDARVGECATINELRAQEMNKCEGGYVGIFDMVGNAEEWTSDCASADPNATCFVNGGCALDHLADCTTSKPYPRSTKRPLVGFRCCAD